MRVGDHRPTYGGAASACQRQGSGVTSAWAAGGRTGCSHSGCCTRRALRHAYAALIARTRLRASAGSPSCRIPQSVHVQAGKALAAGAARAAQPLRAPPAGRAGAHRRQEARVGSRRAPATGSRQSRLAAAADQANAAGQRANQTGWECVHVCVDDASRLAYVEVLADEKGATAVGFLRRAIAFYARHGIAVERVMTDNGPAYRSARPRACLPGARHPPPADPALPAAHQRQGRALHPHAPRRLGLRRDLRLKP